MPRRAKTDDPDARALMMALSREDAELMEMKRQLDAIRIGWQLATRKYTAVRDLFIEKFGVNPYSLNPDEFGASSFQSSGRFRFILMNPGEAAMQVLRETENELSLEEITGFLRGGGLGFTDARTVSAALMKKGGITQTKEGKYRYDPQVDPEEIPFE